MNDDIETRARSALDATLAWSRAREYRGHNKHDGLNSPLLWATLGWGYWPRLVAIQSVMRAPVNIRPLLGVPRTRNPKGLGLFTRSYLDLYRATGEARWLEEAKGLMGWLEEHPSRGFRGRSWGYPYPWQDVGFYAPRDYPNRVVTCFVAQAFLDAHRTTGDAKYLRIVDEILEFLLEEPRVLEDTADMLCLSYVPSPDVSWVVMDVSVLVGAVVALHARQSGNRDRLPVARRLVHYVVDKQTDYGAWYYSHPAGASHIRHDNYHTGFILDAIRDYMDASGDLQYMDAYDRGLKFYAEKLFSPSGAPRWMSDQEYPYDIHGSAQGVITFSRARDRDPSYDALAGRILRWALDEMYVDEGRFRYQKTRWLTKSFTLLRWCNAWMCRALGAYLTRAG